MTEAFWAAVPVAGTQADKLHTVGKPMPNDEVKIVDENGLIVDRNTPGELWIRSISNFLGYLNEPEKTRAALTEDGWFKTGYAHSNKRLHSLLIRQRSG